MSQRFLTLILLPVLLLASITSVQPAKAFPADGQGQSGEQANAKTERILREAGKSAIFDQAGRVAELTLPVSDGKNINFSFIYDERSRLQYLIQGDGTRMELLYDSAGQWQGFIFPDGGRMTLVRDRAGNINGFDVEQPGGRKTSKVNHAGARGARLHPASAILVDDCKAAVDRATDAAIAAGIACLPGPSPVCAAAAAWAAYTGYAAYKACKKDLIDEEPVA